MVITTGTNYDTCYLGPCWENFTTASGEIVFTKLYAYRMNREVRFALTESEAQETVAAALAEKG